MHDRSSLLDWSCLVTPVQRTSPQCISRGHSSSRKTAGPGVTLQDHSDETKKFWHFIFRHKLAWTMKQHDVSHARVINADETCVRLLASEHIRMEPSRQQGEPDLRIEGSHHWRSRGSHGCRGSAVFAAHFSRARRTRAGRVKTAYPTRSVGTHSVRHPNTLVNLPKQ